MAHHQQPDGMPQEQLDQKKERVQDPAHSTTRGSHNSTIMPRTMTGLTTSTLTQVTALPLTQVTV